MILAGNADPIILNPHPDKARHRSAKNAQAQGTLSGHEFHRVANEIGQDLFKRGRIGDDCAEGRYQFDDATAFLDFTLDGGQHFLDGVFQTDGNQRHVAPSQPAVGEQILQERVHILSRTPDALGEIEPLRIKTGTFLFEECLSEAAHRAQRGAQVMGD